MNSEGNLVRRLVRITGIVQGVGFRPFVSNLAVSRNLCGWVRNMSGCVEIDVEGPRKSVEAFLASLASEAPSLARVSSVTAIEADPAGYDKFDILESHSEAEVAGVIPVDVATCPECRKEITDPCDRRLGYEFTNCTNCGPRFTIVRRVPYDRANTTMSAFEMCPECAAEYRDCSDRRFHAEPTACPACGPSVWVEIDGQRVEDDALRLAGRLLREGRVVAVKGLGGFHLACDARKDDAVRLLRARKGRVAKPFAVMVSDIEEAERACELNEVARDLLLSARRPIVLCRKRVGSGVSDQVAPGNRNFGVMLPYTPLHTLLFEHSPSILVMTSGNLSEEPLVFTNSTARTKLASLADAYLMHNRDIHVPCDDSVVRADDPCGSILVRRARGFVPEAIELPSMGRDLRSRPIEAILGVGAEQKNTFCLAWGSQAVMGQHIGDLDTVETFEYFRYAIDHFHALFGRRPEVIAHDLHPDYLSTRYARELSGVRLVGVQHHHAHIASCLAENRRADRCIGLAMDGTGYGTDGTIWGGEVLLADLAGYERVGRFAPLRMSGGEASIRDPRRMAAAYLHAAYEQDFERMVDKLELGFTELERRVILRQLETGLNSPVTSSAGRLFDAVSAAIDVCRERTFEGQPAIELEMAADEAENGAYPTAVTLSAVEGQDGLVTLDGASVFRAAVEEHLSGVDRSIVAARFHNSVVELLARACVRVRDRTGLNLVALSGGVFQNAIILWRLKRRLESAGFEVLIHRLVPPNDACISLGQVAVVSASPHHESTK